MLKHCIQCFSQALCFFAWDHLFFSKPRGDIGSRGHVLAITASKQMHAGAIITADRHDAGVGKDEKYELAEMQHVERGDNVTARWNFDVRMTTGSRKRRPICEVD